MESFIEIQTVASEIIESDQKEIFPSKKVNTDDINFLEKISNIERLQKVYEYKEVLLEKSKKSGIYLEKVTEEQKIIYTKTTSFKKYMAKEYNIIINKNPYEAFFVLNQDSKPRLIIIEKKFKASAKQIDSKLFSSPIIRDEYSKLLQGKFDVEMILCLGDSFKEQVTQNNTKYEIFFELMKDHKVAILYGEDPNYAENLFKLIN